MPPLFSKNLIKSPFHPLLNLHMPTSSLRSALPLVQEPSSVIHQTSFPVISTNMERLHPSFSVIPSTVEESHHPNHIFHHPSSANPCWIIQNNGGRGAFLIRIRSLYSILTLHRITTQRFLPEQYPYGQDGIGKYMT